MQGPGPCEPCYVISVVARLVNMHPQTLRYYEKLGLIRPSRSDGRISLRVMEVLRADAVDVASTLNEPAVADAAKRNPR